jgi:hypothetical protein
LGEAGQIGQSQEVLLLFDQRDGSIDSVSVRRC